VKLPCGPATVIGELLLQPPVNPLIWEGAVSDDPEPGDLPVDEYCPNVEFGMCCFTESMVKSSANLSWGLFVL